MSGYDLQIIFLHVFLIKKKKPVKVNISYQNSCGKQFTNILTVFNNIEYFIYKNTIFLTYFLLFNMV